MKIKFRNVHFIIIFFGVLLIPLIVTASEDDHEQAKRLLDTGHIISLELILQKARKIHPGKILEVEIENEQNVIVYEIEILDAQGIVWEIKFDASNGDLIKSKKED